MEAGTISSSNNVALLGAQTQSLLQTRQNTQTNETLQTRQVERMQRPEETSASSRARPENEAPRPIVNAEGQKVGGQINTTA